MKVQLTISQQWFRLWLGTEQVPSHNLNQCWSLSMMRLCSKIELLSGVEYIPNPHPPPTPISAATGQVMGCRASALNSSSYHGFYHLIKIIEVTVIINHLNDVYGNIAVLWINTMLSDENEKRVTTHLACDIITIYTKLRSDSKKVYPSHFNWLRQSDAYICIDKLTIIGSDDGLSPERRQTIIWTNAGILLIWPLGTNFG